MKIEHSELYKELERSRSQRAELERLLQSRDAEDDRKVKQEPSRVACRCASMLMARRIELEGTVRFTQRGGEGRGMNVDWTWNTLGLRGRG